MKKLESFLSFLLAAANLFVSRWKKVPHAALVLILTGVVFLLWMAGMIHGVVMRKLPGFLVDIG